MLSTERITIRRLELQDAEALFDLRTANRRYLEPFEPRFPESHFTLAGQREAIERGLEMWEKDQGYPFGIFLNETGHLIGRVILSNVVRGAWQNCTLGYFIAEGQQGKGYMTEAVTLAVRFAFDHVDLHRVQAAVIPRNQRSSRVLQKVGFRYEGLSKYYLFINQVWEDHHIYALTREDWDQLAE
ncbi:GNAT family N-acetyltransferase [Laceyella putida]|uniref:GNAT family N-acetyltransferase n=1 Tax=Laceyella putida TaxID=110101 RepID=A0ABW2RID8_9BACL